MGFVCHRLFLRFFLRLRVNMRLVLSMHLCVNSAGYTLWNPIVGEGANFLHFEAKSHNFLELGRRGYMV